MLTPLVTLNHGKRFAGSFLCIGLAWGCSGRVEDTHPPASPSVVAPSATASASTPPNSLTAPPIPGPQPSSGPIQTGGNPPQAPPNQGVVPGGPLMIGDTCHPSRTCEAPRACLAVGVDGGKSSGAYCTKDCSNDSTVCGAEAACEQVGNTKLCLPRCPTQPGFHCGTSVCRTGALTGLSLCFPFCNRDSDCHTGRCDPGSGLCTTQQALGSGPTGAPCVSDNECAGICSGDALGVRQCTRICQAGGYLACGAMDACFPLGDPVTAPINSVGQCVQGCMCDAHCLNPDMLCDPFTGLELLKLWNRHLAGICRPRSTGSPGLPLCGL